MEGCFKINFDTSLRDSFFAQTTVCRDFNDHIIKAISQISHPCDPNFGEALAACLATLLAVSLNLMNFILEEDSVVVILTLQEPSRILD